MAQTQNWQAAPLEFHEAYGLRRRLMVAAIAVAAALVLAGFWNLRAIDGFGRDVIATPTLGDPRALSTTFPERGFAFGFLFA